MSTGERKVVNSYDQMRFYGGDRVALFYMGGGAGRGSMPGRWGVYRYVDGREIPTDPEAAWYDNGHKTFSPFLHAPGQAGVKAARLAAEAWVAETYGKREFVRNRMGDYVEREVNAKYPIPKKQSTPTDEAAR